MMLKMMLSTYCHGHMADMAHMHDLWYKFCDQKSAKTNDKVCGNVKYSLMATI